MKPHARRLALLTVAAGCVVMVGFSVVWWRRNLEEGRAERFIATRRTVIMRPEGILDTDSNLKAGYEQAQWVFQALARSSRCPVIFDPACASDSLVRISDLANLSSDLLLKILHDHGFEIVRVKSPAFVVIGYPSQRIFEEGLRS